MKKIAFMAFALCAILAQAACNNTKGTDKGDEPIPMFVQVYDSLNLEMIYWTGFDQPAKDEDNDKYYEDWYNEWFYQDQFRKHKEEYTKILANDQTFAPIKFVNEIAIGKGEGEFMEYGMIRSSLEVKTPGSFYAMSDPESYDSEKFFWMHLIVTDSYLASHKLLAVDYFDYSESDTVSLPQNVVQKLEKKYGMKASRSAQVCKIGNRYIFGLVQFEGEYKNAPKDPDDDRKYCLALDVLIDGNKVYCYEDLGNFDEVYGQTWNVDDDGMYIPTGINAAFDGPKGLELYYVRTAPESCAVGRYTIQNGKLEKRNYSTYYIYYD